MRTLLIAVITNLIFLSSNAQNNLYLETMETNVSAIKNATDVNSLQMISGKFEGISMIEKENWIPAYYAIYSLLNATTFEKDGDKKDKILDKAQLLLDKYQEKFPNECEIIVLQAYTYQFRMNVDGMRAMKYGPKASMLLQETSELYPENPRVRYLLGMNIYYTPKMFGGGAENALVHFQKAKELYESFVIDIPFYPEWGKENNSKLLKSCEAALVQ